MHVGFIAGPDGEEIHTDTYGRVKLWMPWDRKAKKDGSDSPWIRVSQAWAGSTWGGQIIPRIGQEAMVAFIGGDPDRPVVLGLAPNAKQTVPYDLPANKTRSTFRSNSHKSVGFNEFSLEDKTGGENMFFHAQKDHTTRVLNDRTARIDSHDVHSVVRRDRDEFASGRKIVQPLACLLDEWKQVDGQEFVAYSPILTQQRRPLRVGPSLAAETEIGPLINARQKSKVMGFLKQARSEGADFEDDPDIDSAGHFVRPTIVFNASQQMSIVREEVFGPVLPIVPFDDFDEAIHLANDSAFGLSSCIWTNDLRTAHRLIPRIKSGRVAVNTDPLPYPLLPEGGRKASGYGRDLGEEAIEGYLETKAVLIRSA